MDYRTLKSFDKLLFELINQDILTKKIETPDVLMEQLQAFNYSLKVFNLACEEYLQNSFFATDKKGLKEYYKERVSESIVLTLQGFKICDKKIMIDGIVDRLDETQKYFYLRKRDSIFHLFCSILKKIDLVFYENSESEQQAKLIDEPEDSRAKLKKSYLGLTYDQMDKSYTYFNNFLFKDLTFDEYLICFEQDKPIEKHPTFIKRKMINFIKFLDGIQTVTINNKIAKDRFGIKNYKQSNSQGFGETKENIVFKSKIGDIYKLNDIKIY